MEKSDGCFELCDSFGPFKDVNGRYFPKVHDVIPLAEYGPDTVENAVALYPHCHRRCHYSPNRPNIAVQVTEGLDAAHSEEIIHWDLKPANAMIAAKENVGILDFGRIQSS